MIWLDSIIDSMHMNSSKHQKTVNDRKEGLSCCSSWGHKESEQSLSDRTITTIKLFRQEIMVALHLFATRMCA